MRYKIRYMLRGYSIPLLCPDRHDLDCTEKGITRETCCAIATGIF